MALVIGVSDYPDPKYRLPAVAADVREMAKVLSSKHGTFSSSGVTTVVDKQASCKKVLAALRTAFDGTAVDTLFVYLAGHGIEARGNYFYVAYDSTNETNAIPLSEIRALFDQSKSRRVFLWLDFCHSGGILARGLDDMEAIRREIGVVSGRGKVIVAACTSSQNSYESATIGHGFFTHALLRGLRGEAKTAHGEVTAHSLYEFIDHQVASAKQQPVFFGETEGRIVLTRYSDRGSGLEKVSPRPKTANRKKKKEAKKRGTWVMLGDDFFVAESVRHSSDNLVEVTATSISGAEAAVFSALRPGNYANRISLPFAANNDAWMVRVQKVESESLGERQVWTLMLAVEDSDFNSPMEVSYSTGSESFSPDDAARERAKWILLGDPFPIRDSSGTFDSNTFIRSWIQGSGRFQVRQCVVSSLFRSHGQQKEWRTFARLRSVFMLKASGVVKHVFELKIGSPKAGAVKVEFRGQRRAQSGATTGTKLEVVGLCSLVS